MTTRLRPLHVAGSVVWLAIGLLAAFTASARVGTPPHSYQMQVQPVAMVKQLVLPATDVAAQLAADQRRGIGFPLRYAVDNPVEITPDTDGTWEQLPDGRLWRLRVKSPGATDLNFGFSKFWLPEGATLYVISENEHYYQGPYTARDNQPHGQLWTPVVPGDAAVIELFVPSQAARKPQIVLAHINTGYRDLFHTKSSLAASTVGSCEIDAVCPQAAGWSNQVRSVALYSVYGTLLCTGTLIADVAGDFRNYFLTAAHCGVNADSAPTMVVYWNYQSPVCGELGGGSLAQNQSGAVFRAARHDVDFALVELDEMPDPGFRVYYSGWDRSGATPAGAVGIHQPDASVKCISFSFNPLTTVSSCIGTVGTNTHWQVIWSEGVTEPGSSGSGLWDPATHLLVGTLSGGESSCSYPNGPDCYGKFSVAWNGDGSPSDELKDWLDPDNTGATRAPGIDPMLFPIIRPAGSSLVAESFFPTNGAIDPGERVVVNFTLQNLGGVATRNLVATLLPGDGISHPGPPQRYGALTSGAFGSQPFVFTACGECGATITANLQLRDGRRKLGVATFNLRLGKMVPVTVLQENFDEIAAPALPAGWNTTTNGGIAWATSTAEADTPSNSAFIPDAGYVTDNSLVSPSIFIHSTNTELTFRQSYNVESGYDGGVLEMALGGGSFQDILAAGGTFATNGYNQKISTYFGSPLAGRSAWSGNSEGFITTVVNLPPTVAGQNIQLRWRFGSDNSYGIAGWFVDDVQITEPGYTCTGSMMPPVMFNLRALTPGNLAFSFDQLEGQTYYIESTTNLNRPVWTTLQTNLGHGTRVSFTNSAPESYQCFFRVRTQ